MKTLKFRAWDKLERKTDSPKFFTYFNLQDLNEGKINFPDWENWEITMFTGLLSKDGKEIYEGDIVKDIDTSDLTFEVKWDNEKSMYSMPPEYDEEYVYSMGNSPSSFEVVGNIYENPELLNL